MLAVMTTPLLVVLLPVIVLVAAPLSTLIIALIYMDQRRLIMAIIRLRICVDINLNAFFLRSFSESLR